MAYIKIGGPPGQGLGVRLTTSPCENKIVENLLEEAHSNLQGCGATDDSIKIGNMFPQCGKVQNR